MMIQQKRYNKDYLKAIQQFDLIAEEKLRDLLNMFYDNHRSRDQAWKTCKGSLYEYAVFKCIQQVIMENMLDSKLLVIIEDSEVIQYKDQIVIHN